MVAAHRIQRDAHGLLLLFFGSYDDAALVLTAIGADVMRQDRLLAVRAILHLQRFDMLMTSPHSLPRMRSPSLRDCHSSAFLKTPRFKRSMLDVLAGAVKVARESASVRDDAACGLAVADSPPEGGIT